MFSRLRAFSIWLSAITFAGISVGGHGLHLYLHHSGESDCQHHSESLSESHAQHAHRHHCHHQDADSRALATTPEQAPSEDQREHDHDCLVCHYYLQGQQSVEILTFEVQQSPTADAIAVSLTSPPSSPIESYQARGPPVGGSATS